MADNSESGKKKVLALPVDDDGEDKVLLLEPGEPRGEAADVAPPDSSPEDEPGTEEEIEADEPPEPDAEDEPEAKHEIEAEEPSEADTEDASEEPGTAEKLTSRLPFGTSDDETDEEEEEAEAEPAEPDEEEEGSKPSLMDRLPLPFGKGRKTTDEEEEEADEAEDASDEPEEAEAPEPPAPQEPAAEEVEETIDLEEAEVVFERLSEPEAGIKEMSLGDEGAGVELDPIPYESGEGTEEGEPRLDEDMVRRIQHAVDTTLHRQTRRQRSEQFSPEAVDEITRSAGTDTPKAARESLPETDRDLADVVGMSPEDRSELREQGVESIADLLGRDAVALAVDTGLKISDVRDWQHKAELLHVDELDPSHADLLTKVGIKRLDVLAEQDADDLAKRLQQYRKYRESVVETQVTAELTGTWIDAAERLTAAQAAP